MNKLLKQYINKITINNINDFAIKNNIVLTKKELNILYDLIKNHHEEIINNENNTKEYLKQNISAENFNKIISIYEEYKQKYINYFR